MPLSRAFNPAILDNQRSSWQLCPDRSKRGQNCLLVGSAVQLIMLAYPAYIRLCIEAKHSLFLGPPRVLLTLPKVPTQVLRFSTLLHALLRLINAYVGVGQYEDTLFVGMRPLGNASPN